MAMCQTRPSIPLHRRASSNLAIPPNRTILRHVNERSFPSMANNGSPNCSLLRPWGFMALLVSQGSTHSNALQENSQASSSVQRSIRSRSRIRVSNRSHDISFRISRNSNYLGCRVQESAHSDDVHVDCVEVIPGYRRTLWIRVPMELAPHPTFLGRCRSPWCASWEISRQLFEFVQMVGLLSRNRSWLFQWQES